MNLIIVKLVISGRLSFKNKKKLCFDWPGINISFIFEGVKADIILKDGGNDYNVFIDDNLDKVICTRKGTKKYSLINSKFKKKRRITITKRTGSYDSKAIIKRLMLDQGAKLLKPEIKTSKRILFLGDSVTVGYGIEGKSIDCNSERKYKNNYLSFGPLLCRMIQAEYHIVAISGRGLIKNYGAWRKKSKRPLPVYLHNTLIHNKKETWNHETWIPQAIFMNLGTNNFAEKPYPNKDDFIMAYKIFIEEIKKKYPHSTILCISGPTQQEPFYTYFNEIIKSFEGKNVYRIDIGAMREDEYGCDFHPNVKSHFRIAKEILAQLKKYDLLMVN